MKRIFFLALVLFISACKNNTTTEEETNGIAEPTTINYSIVKVFPHDTLSYTQGLIYHNNKLFESTGSPEGVQTNGSWFGIANIETGIVDKKASIKEFGEGITILGNKLYQLTWQEHKVYVYDTATYKLIQTFDWPEEGWGITHNGKQLIVSTGSNNLYFVNPETFKVEKVLGVFDNNGPRDRINELEYVNGEVYANIFLTNYIVKIDLATGLIKAKMDCSNIMQQANIPLYPNADVLNGIAYDATTNHFYITGKKWPALFKVKLN